MLSLVPSSGSTATTNVNRVTGGWNRVNRTVFYRYKDQESSSQTVYGHHCAYMRKSTEHCKINSFVFYFIFFLLKHIECASLSARDPVFGSCDWGQDFNADT